MSASVYKSNPLGRKTAYSSCSSKQFGGRITVFHGRLIGSASTYGSSGPRFFVPGLCLGMSLLAI
jgi:hypothetical protein